MSQDVYESIRDMLQASAALIARGVPPSARMIGNLPPNFNSAVGPLSAANMGPPPTGLFPVGKV